MKHDAFHQLLQSKINSCERSPLVVTDLVVQVADLKNWSAGSQIQRDLAEFNHCSCPMSHYPSMIFISDAPMDLEDPGPHHSTYVFSPLHTRLRDRSTVEQRDVTPSATSSELTLPEREDADEEKIMKPRRRGRPGKRLGFCY